MRDFDPREIGLLYYVMASSQTLGDALKRIARYSHITNEAKCCSNCGVSWQTRSHGQAAAGFFKLKFKAFDLGAHLFQAAQGGPEEVVASPGPPRPGGRGCLVPAPRTQPNNGFTGN